MIIGHGLKDCDKIQKSTHRLPRDHRNTPWQHDIDRARQDHVLSRRVSNMIGIASAVLAIFAVIVWVTA